MDMKLFLQIMANASGLKREMGESKTAVSRFTQGAKREFDALKSTMGSVHGQLAALGITVGALQQVRMSAQLDKDLTQIGQTAGVGSAKITTLRSDLFRMGKESGQDIESLKNGFISLVQSGLNMKESTNTLEGVNVAMAVTGAKAETLAAGLTVAAQAFQFDLAKPGQALELLDKMTVAGRLGNAELENLSQIFSRVGINAQAAGLNFDKTLGFIEALSKVERNPERLATLADSTLRVFTNMNYMASAQKGTGIRFYGQGGKRRDPLEVLQEIRKKYVSLKTDLQKDSFIQAAFGKADLDTIKGLRTLLQSNNLSEVLKITGAVEKAGGSLKKDFNVAIFNLIDASGRLKNTMRDAADGFIKPINETLAAWINFVVDKKENGGLELSGKQIAGGTAAIVGGSLLAARAGNAVLGEWAKKKMGNFGLSTAIGVAQGKALEAATGVTPVFITNWEGATSSLPTPAPGPIAQQGKNILPFLGKMGAAGAGGFIALELGKMFDRMTGGSGEYYDEGFFPGGSGAKKAGAKNDITINLQIDGNTRVFAQSNSMGTSATIGGKRGSFFDAMLSTEAM